MPNKFVQYSKLMPVITGIIFCICLKIAFSIDYETVSDTAIMVTAITTSGGIFGSTLVWYMKKSQSENAYKLKLGLYKEILKDRYKYNEKMIALKSAYGVLKAEENDDFDDDFMEELSDTALNDTITVVDESMNDANESVEIQNF